jgi:hypothetical protein
VKARRARVLRVQEEPVTQVGLVPVEQGPVDQVQAAAVREAGEEIAEEMVEAPDLEEDIIRESYT